MFSSTLAATVLLFRVLLERPNSSSSLTNVWTIPAPERVMQTLLSACGHIAPMNVAVRRLCSALGWLSNLWANHRSKYKERYDNANPIFHKHLHTNNEAMNTHMSRFNSSSASSSAIFESCAECLHAGEVRSPICRTI